MTIHESRTAVGERTERIAEASARRPYDLVFLGWDARGGRELAEAALAGGAEQLLFVPGESPVPARMLVCVAVGEPGKRDVAFTARLSRHLGAETTVMTVLPEGQEDEAARDAARRFVEGGVRTLEGLGVRAVGRVRSGDPEREIRAQLVEGGHDLLVLGSPLPRRGDRLELRGLLRRFLEEGPDRPLLVVRSPHRTA
jgi:K+-sensing histidine kinase KdpD